MNFGEKRGRKEEYMCQRKHGCCWKEGRAVDGCFVVAFRLGVSFLEATSFATLDKIACVNFWGFPWGNKLTMWHFV